MGSRVLEIIATLNDQVTAKLDQMGGGLQRLEKNLISNGHQAVLFGRTLQQVGLGMTMAGAAITAPLMLAYNNAGKFSAQIAAQQYQMKQQWDEISISIGKSMVPVMQQLLNTLESVVKWWTSLSQAARDHIIQTALVAGQYLLTGGVILHTLGEVFKIFGDLGILLGKTLKFVQALAQGFIVLFTANLPLLVIYATVGLIILAMMKWKAVGDVVMNTLQTGGDVIAIAFRSILLIIDQVSAAIYHLMSFIIGIVEKIPMLPKAWKDALDGMRTQFDSYSAGILDASDRNVKKIGDDFNFLGTSGAGSWALGFDNAKNSFGNFIGDVQKGIGTINQLRDALNGGKGSLDNPSGNGMGFWDGFQMGILDTQIKMSNMFEMGKTMATAFYNDMKSSFSSFFDDVFTGQLNKASQLFVNFGNSLIKTFSNVLSQMATNWIMFGNMFGGTPGTATGGIFGALGSLFGKAGAAASPAGISLGATDVLPNFGPLTLHGGGMIKRAHDGMLAGDEIPIIAQTGEAVLSRRAVSTLGSDNVNNLNAGRGLVGGSSGGVVININTAVQSWTPQDIQNNGAAIMSVINNGIMNNSTIRTLIKQYGGN